MIATRTVARVYIAKFFLLLKGAGVFGDLRNVGAGEGKGWLYY